MNKVRITAIRQTGEGNFYDGWMKNPMSAMISCNDGFRPFSFYRNATTGDKKNIFRGTKNGSASLFGGHLGAKLGKNLQTNNTQNKNLQKPKQSLTLENKRFTGLFLQILCVSLQSDYFPTQKCWKILLSVSWGVICSPVISARMSRVWRRSSERRSALSSLCKPSRT